MRNGAGLRNIFTTAWTDGRDHMVKYQLHGAYRKRGQGEDLLVKDYKEPFERRQGTEQRGEVMIPRIALNMCLIEYRLHWAPEKGAGRQNCRAG